MNDEKSTDPQLARQFEEKRLHLRAVAYRMLGSKAEADDAVQEAWLRLQRSDTSAVDNLGGWLTTVVARVCLDQLRARRAQREDPLDAELTIEAEQETMHLADAVGPALIVLLDTLAPAERLAFVLHDMFGVSFEEIAPIVGRSPEASRQLASRARRRVRGATPPATDRDRRHEVIAAFLAASRNGDFTALLGLLDPAIEMRADGFAAKLGAPQALVGAEALAKHFSGRARQARPAFIDGDVGAVWAPGGTPHVVLRMQVANGKITAIDVIADPDAMRALDLILLELPER